jgi:hypothetical protein
MSDAVFEFRFLRRSFREYGAYRTEVYELPGGRRIMHELHAAEELVVRGTLLFPDLKTGKTFADFADFWRGRRGPADWFLYKAGNPGAKLSSELPEIDSGVQVLFAASRRFVDTDTLVVSIDDVEQELGVDYTIENEAAGAYVLGTSNKLFVHFTDPPGLGVQIQLDYEFYYPVRFEGDEMIGDQELYGGGFGSAAVADRTVAVTMRETGPGFSYADAPNVIP